MYNVKYSQTWARNNPARAKACWRKHSLKWRYGITEALYNSILGNQLGLCAICCKPQSNGKNLCIDHDHKTGEIRGLLCIKCNRDIGIYERRSEELKIYLEVD